MPEKRALATYAISPVGCALSATPFFKGGDALRSKRIKGAFRAEPLGGRHRDGSIPYEAAPAPA